MKRTNKFLVAIVGLLLTAPTIFAQVKIGDNVQNIKGASMLEIESKKKGVLFPRVNIPDLSVWTLTGTPVKNMMVINTNTTQGEGLYRWDGNKWVKATASSQSEWINSGDTLIYAKRAKTAGNDVVVKKDGRVGIGTSSVGNQLTVYSENPIYFPDTGFGNGAYGGIDMVAKLPTTLNSAVRLGFRNASAGHEYTWIQYAGGPQGFYGVEPNSFEIWEYPDYKNYPGVTGARKRFVIESTQDIPDPFTGRQLPVVFTKQGNVSANGFIARGVTLAVPDYVFENYYEGTSEIKKEYKFNSLQEVEKFVKTNKHLPGYKSAKEIKKDGYVDVTKTQMTNMEKIEELYLHTIEQQKLIDNQNIKMDNQNIKMDNQAKEIEELKALVKQMLKK